MHFGHKHHTKETEHHKVGDAAAPLYSTLEHPEMEKIKEEVAKTAPHLTPEEIDQAAEDAVPSAVASWAFGLPGAVVGAFMDLRANKKFVADLKQRKEEKCKKMEAEKAKIVYGPASADIFSGLNP